MKTQAGQDILQRRESRRGKYVPINEQIQSRIEQSTDLLLARLEQWQEPTIPWERDNTENQDYKTKAQGEREWLQNLTQRGINWDTIITHDSYNCTHPCDNSCECRCHKDRTQRLCDIIDIVSEINEMHLQAEELVIAGIAPRHIRTRETDEFTNEKWSPTVEATPCRRSCSLLRKRKTKKRTRRDKNWHTSNLQRNKASHITHGNEDWTAVAAIVLCGVAYAWIYIRRNRQGPNNREMHALHGNIPNGQTTQRNKIIASRKLSRQEYSSASQEQEEKITHREARTLKTTDKDKETKEEPKRINEEVEDEGETIGGQTKRLCNELNLQQRPDRQEESVDNHDPKSKEETMQLQQRVRVKLLGKGNIERWVKGDSHRLRNDRWGTSDDYAQEGVDRTRNSQRTQNHHTHSTEINRTLSQKGRRTQARENITENCSKQDSIRTEPLENPSHSNAKTRVKSNWEAQVRAEQEQHPHKQNKETRHKANMKSQTKLTKPKNRKKRGTWSNFIGLAVIAQVLRVAALKNPSNGPTNKEMHAKNGNGDKERAPITVNKKVKRAKKGTDMDRGPTWNGQNWKAFFGPAAKKAKEKSQNQDQKRKDITPTAPWAGTPQDQINERLQNPTRSTPEGKEGGQGFGRFANIWSDMTKLGCGCRPCPTCGSICLGKFQPPHMRQDCECDQGHLWLGPGSSGGIDREAYDKARAESMKQRGNRPETDWVFDSTQESSPTRSSPHNISKRLSWGAVAAASNDSIEESDDSQLWWCKGTHCRPRNRVLKKNDICHHCNNEIKRESKAHLPEKRVRRGGDQEHALTRIKRNKLAHIKNGNAVNNGADREWTVRAIASVTNADRGVRTQMQWWRDTTEHAHDYLETFYSATDQQATRYMRANRGQNNPRLGRNQQPKRHLEEIDDIIGHTLEVTAQLSIYSGRLTMLKDRLLEVLNPENTSHSVLRPITVQDIPINLGTKNEALKGTENPIWRHAVDTADGKPRSKNGPRSRTSDLEYKTYLKTLRNKETN